MDIKKILSYVDHTLLSQSATWEEIRAVLDDGMKYSCASCCIPASYVKEAKGFPNGYSTTATKCFETEDAVKNGADEIDMVINIGWLKDKRYDLLLNEIKAIKEACNGKLLKVIIETCLLTDEEKVKMCEIVSASGANFIKTSTGFSTAGATRHDVEIFANNVASHLKIKAAGGISSLEDAEDFIALGATRLGTSRIVKIVKAMEKGEENDKQDTSY